MGLFFLILILAFVFKVHIAVVICHWLANGFHALIAFIMFAIIVLAAMARHTK